MKRLVFLLIFCICAVFSNAQVINRNGQKVVRQIEAYLPNTVSPYIIIDFNYSDSLDLEEICFNAPSTGTIKWKKEGSTIVRFQYDIDRGDRNDLDYCYTLNEDDIITRCVIDNIGIGGCVLRYDYEYTYDINNRITSSYKRVFSRERNEKFGELSDRYKEIFKWDTYGNVFTTDEHGYKWKEKMNFDHNVDYDGRKYYSDLINDTNIDLPSVYWNTYNCERLEFVTEWNGNHSSSLIKEDNMYYFHYTLDNEYGGNSMEDDKGNIIEMDVYNSLKILEKTYKIYYWK